MNGNWPEWLADGLSWGTHCVGSYVPSGFERYLRLEHRDSWSDDPKHFLRKDQFRALCDVVGSEGEFAGTTWALFWEGYDRDRLRAFEGRYALYLSTLCEVCSSSIEELLDVSSRSDRYSRGWISPTLWFDDKRTWCIATPVYWPCSFIGCSTLLFEQLGQGSALRLVETTWGDEFSRD